MGLRPNIMLALLNQLASFHSPRFIFSSPILTHPQAMTDAEVRFSYHEF